MYARELYQAPEALGDFSRGCAVAAVGYPVVESDPGASFFPRVTTTYWEAPPALPRHLVVPCPGARAPALAGGRKSGLVPPKPLLPALRCGYELNGLFADFE